MNTTKIGRVVEARVSLFCGRTHGVGLNNEIEALEIEAGIGDGALAEVVIILGLGAIGDLGVGLNSCGAEKQEVCRADIFVKFVFWKLNGGEFGGFSKQLASVEFTPSGEHKTTFV